MNSGNFSHLTPQNCLQGLGVALLVCGYLFPNQSNLTPNERKNKLEDKCKPSKNYPEPRPTVSSNLSN
jgi:hypothetical protein